jgi:restriction endonuclease S subunit
LIDGVRGGAQPNVNVTTLSLFIIPISPLDEQCCIVKRIGLIMEIIYQMEDKSNKKVKIIKKLGIS